MTDLMGTEMTDPQSSPDPRDGVTIPAGVDVDEAAALLHTWLSENVDKVQDRARFVVLLDEFVADYDFTIACVKGLSAGLPDCGR
jgi:hypothetical protein